MNTPDTQNLEMDATQIIERILELKQTGGTYQEIQKLQQLLN